MTTGDEIDDVLVSAEGIVKGLSKAQRARLDDPRVLFLKIPTYRLRGLVDAVEVLGSD